MERKRRNERQRYDRDPASVIARQTSYLASLDAEAMDEIRRKARERVHALGYTAAKRSSDQRRRARKVGATVEKFPVAEIYDRDGWQCGICSDVIDSTLSYPDSMSVSLDHIVPLSLGGEHSRINTRASHLGCNVRRGNRVAV